MSEKRKPRAVMMRTGKKISLVTRVLAKKIERNFSKKFMYAGSCLVARLGFGFYGLCISFS